MSNHMPKHPYDNTFGDTETKETIRNINIAEELKQEGVEHMTLDLELLKRELMET